MGFEYYEKLKCRIDHFKKLTPNNAPNKLAKISRKSALRVVVK